MGDKDDVGHKISYLGQMFLRGSNFILRELVLRGLNYVCLFSFLFSIEIHPKKLYLQERSCNQIG